MAEAESSICERRYGQGKYIFSAKGDEKYREIAKQAFATAIQIFPQFDKEKFIAQMRKANVPDDKILEYTTSLYIDDDLYHCEGDHRR